MAANYKNPPEMRDNLLYEDWKKELDIWLMFTDLAKERQGPAIFLTLKGKARETLLAELKPVELGTADGPAKITTALDKLYVKNASASAFNAFENFSLFRRSNTMSIKDYIIEFNLRLCKIKSHDMTLPEGVLAYYLLSCANLPDEQTALCRATCSNLTYADMKTQIERVSTTSESETGISTTEVKVKVEPQFIAQYDESAFYYEEADEEYEQQTFETEDTYYNAPGSWPSTGYQSGGNRFAPKYTEKMKKNPLDEFGNPAPCRFCKSIYHWVDQCPDAPPAVKNVSTRGARGYPRRNVRYAGRSRGRGFNPQRQF